MLRKPTWGIRVWGTSPFRWNLLPPEKKLVFLFLSFIFAPLKMEVSSCFCTLSNMWKSFTALPLRDYYHLKLSDAALFSAHIIRWRWVLVGKLVNCSFHLAADSVWVQTAQSLSHLYGVHLLVKSSLNEHYVNLEFNSTRSNKHLFCAWH